MQRFFLFRIWKFYSHLLKSLVLIRSKISVFVFYKKCILQMGVYASIFDFIAMDSPIQNFIIRAVFFRILKGILFNTSLKFITDFFNIFDMFLVKSCIFVVAYLYYSLSCSIFFVIIPALNEMPFLVSI